MSKGVDVTERKDAERQKNEFLALLAHELRNPLAPICSALHVLGEPGADPATAARMREMADRQVEHMARLRMICSMWPASARGALNCVRKRWSSGRPWCGRPSRSGRSAPSGGMNCR